MARKPPNYWNKERCSDEASKYKSRNSFSDNARGAYKAACKNEWMDDICQHMHSLVKPVGYWKKEKCLIEALKYFKRSDFQDNAGSAYNSALSNDWLDEICSHMKVMRHTWSKPEVHQEALKYNTRNDFSLGCPAAYSWAQRRTFLDDVCSHMEVAGSQERRCIYSIINRRLNKVYIGITLDFNKRISDHKGINNSTNSRWLVCESDTTYEQLTGYIFSKEDVKNWAESFFHQMYMSFGFEMINDTARLGAVGSGDIIWDFQACHVEALKYSNRRDFRAGAEGAWSAAHKKGWIDKVCSHMTRLEKPKGYWTKEKCAEEALKYKYKSEFENGCGSAYLTAMRNKWLTDICQHMTRKQIKGRWDSVEDIAKEALKYNSKSEFSKGSNQAYSVALKKGCLNEVCSHMTVKKVNKGYWTKEKCAEVALMCTTSKEFQQKYKTAYKKSIENKWLKDIRAHMENPTMWNHHDANIDVWKLASTIYDRWNSSSKCGSKKLSKIMGYDKDLLKTIVNHFKKGWIPKEDNRWLVWMNLEEI